MVGISALFFLSSVTATVPTTQLPWFEFHDYPMKAFEKHWEGVTRFELLVDPNGRAEKCTIIGTSGHEELDKTTCSLAVFRARFAPARDADGKPAYGMYRSQAVWVIPEDSLPATNPGPDLQVSINQLPDRTLDPPAVQVAYIADQEGRVSGCNLLSGSPAQPTALVEIACREVASRLSVQPVTTARGQPVAVVRTAAVLFTIDQPARGRGK